MATNTKSNRFDFANAIEGRTAARPGPFIASIAGVDCDWLRRKPLDTTTRTPASTNRSPRRPQEHVRGAWNLTEANSLRVLCLPWLDRSDVPLRQVRVLDQLTERGRVRIRLLHKSQDLKTVLLVPLPGIGADYPREFESRRRLPVLEGCESVRPLVDICCRPGLG